jgi:hypothetical protein
MDRAGSNLLRIKIKLTTVKTIMNTKINKVNIFHL